MLRLPCVLTLLSHVLVPVLEVEAEVGFDVMEQVLSADDACIPSSSTSCHLELLQLYASSSTSLRPLDMVPPTKPSANLAIHFIRHGDVFNPEDIFYGQLPGFHLSPKGFQQAKDANLTFAALQKQVAVATGLRETSAFFYSPMLRTRETAEVLATSMESEPLFVSLLQAEDKLIEVYVPYQGLPQADVREFDWDIYSHGLQDEGYETFPDVVQRVMEFVGRLVRSPLHNRTQVVAVTHGDICLVARLWAVRGLSALRAGGLGRPNITGIPYPETASVTTLEFFGEEPFEFPKWVS